MAASSSVGKVAVGWFRNDLRLRDNPMLEALVEKASLHDLPAMLVYIFDPRFYDRSNYGRVTDPSYSKSIPTRKPIDFSSRKCGVNRAHFYLGVLRDLQASLQQIGTELRIFYGKPEEVFAELSASHGSLDVVCLREPVSPEWTDVEVAVEATLASAGGTLTTIWGAMSLYHEDDLPFRVNASPECYTGLTYALGWEDLWRSLNQWTGATPIRVPIPAPQKWELRPVVASPGVWGPIGDDSAALSRLGFGADEVEAALGSVPSGSDQAGRSGETAAWARFEAWMQAPPKVERNDPGFRALGGAYGAGGATCIEDGSVDPFAWKNLSTHDGWTQISKFMAPGCISARAIYHTLASASHWALSGVMHRLMWREFHRLNAIKWHRRLYWLQGPGRQNMVWRADAGGSQIAERWKTGQTGIPYIDAAMRELNQTGWIAYKSRKTVATCLAHDLWIDWRVGAFHFEEMLLDYDVAMNYGNWVFCVRCDKEYHGQRWQTYSHECLKECLSTEAHNDPEAHYIRRWIPELRQVPPAKAHIPWTMTDVEMSESSCVIGKDYPEPVIAAEKLGDMRSCDDVQMEA